GDLGRFDQTIYIGTTYDEPLPQAFLSDAANPAKPLTWANYNIWQLFNSDPTFTADFGWTPGAFDYTPVSAVRYRGIDLPRDAADQAGLIAVTIADPAKATTPALSVTTTNTTAPWAVRSGNLTYIVENPFAYLSEGNRYLAFADLIAPAGTPVRNRALVRLEDVNPSYGAFEIDNLKAMGDYLNSRGVPFTIAVIPEYRDPDNVLGLGTLIKLQSISPSSMP
ncbi:MAG: DUF2334 domain-containing protein, partial [Ilumatobacteraceae bacterium]